MSDTDSFIDEVTEEVRQDKLFAILKKWGWVGVIAVFLIVGGAAYNEYRKATLRADSQAFGDALIKGIEANDEGMSLAALEPRSSNQTALAENLAAASALAAGKQEAAMKAWDRVIAASDIEALYRELSMLKKALALPSDTDIADLRAAFEPLAKPGAPFEPLAREQLALLLIKEGKQEEAISQLKDVLNSATLTSGLQRRASELIVALGGDPSKSDQ